MVEQLGSRSGQTCVGPYMAPNAFQMSTEDDKGITRLRAKCHENRAQLDQTMAPRGRHMNTDTNTTARICKSKYNNQLSLPQLDGCHHWRSTHYAVTHVRNKKK